MKFWKNNRVDQEFEMPVAELAEAFLASRWAHEEMFLERRLVAFLSDPEGPVSAVWDQDDPEFDELLELLLQKPKEA